MKKECIICGSGFDPEKGRDGGILGKCTCGPKCSKRHALLRRRAYYKRWRLEKFPKKKTKCKICRKVFVKKYCSKTCSNECRKINSRRLRTDWQRKKWKSKPIKNCRLCGKFFRCMGREIACFKCRPAFRLSGHEKDKESDYYISKTILHIPIQICPPPLIACKRAQLKLWRLTHTKTKNERTKKHHGT